MVGDTDAALSWGSTDIESITMEEDGLISIGKGVSIALAVVAAGNTLGVGAVNVASDGNALGVGTVNVDSVGNALGVDSLSNGMGLPASFG